MTTLTFLALSRLRAAFLMAILLFVPTEAFAQWQTPNHSVPIGRGPGRTGFDNAPPGISGNIFTSNGPSASPTFKPFDSSFLASISILTPQMYGAVGDGVVDDTTAWINLCAAVQSAGGGTIISPSNKTYRVYSAATSLAVTGPLCNFSSTHGVHIDMNGSTFKVDHVFPSSTPPTVSNAVAGTGGACLLTVSSTAGYYTSDYVLVSGIVGATACNVSSYTPITVIDSTHLLLQGTTFSGTYTSGGSVVNANSEVILLRSQDDQKMYVKDWGFVETNAVTLPIAGQFVGTIGIAVYGAGKDYTFVNPNGTGGQQPLIVFGSSTDTFDQSVSGITVLGGYSVNEIYGLTFSNNGNDVTVRNFLTVNVERSYFAYGVYNHDISITSRNAEANDVLITNGGDSTHLRPTSDIRVNYKVLEQTNGSLFSANSYFALMTCNGGPATNSGGIISNVRVNLDVDLAGIVSNLGPVVQILKGTTSTCSSVLENIVISGAIRNVPNLTAPLFSLFQATDAPWSGETARNISIENVQVSGSSTPSFYIDFAPFQIVTGGGFSCTNVHFPGALNAVNSTPRPAIENDNSCYIGGMYSLAPVFGGTGVFEPTAHTVLIPQGSDPFHMVSPGTAGGVLTSNGTSADPSFKSLRNYIFGTSGPTDLTQGTTSYCGPAWCTGGSASSGFLMPVSGTIKNFTISTGSTPPAGQPFIASVQGSSVTCTISNPNVSCQDTTHTLSVGSSTVYFIVITLSATSGNASFAYSFELDTP